MSLTSTISRIKGALFSKNSSANFGMLMIGLGPIVSILDSVLLQHFTKTMQLIEIPNNLLIGMISVK